MIGVPSVWRPFRGFAQRPAGGWLVHALLPGLLFGGAGFAFNAMPVDLGFNLVFLFGGMMAYLAFCLFGAHAAIIASCIAGLWTWYAWGHYWGWVIFTVEMIAIAIVARNGVTLIVAAILFWAFCGIPVVILAYGYATQLDGTAVTLIALKQALNGVSNAAIGYLAGLGIGWLAGGRRRLPRTVPMHAFLAYCFVGFAVVPAIAMLCWHAFEQKDRVFREAAEQSRSTVDALEAAIDRMQIESAEGLQFLAATLAPLETDSETAYRDRLESVIGLSPGILGAVEYISVREPGGVVRALWSRRAYESPSGLRFDERNDGTGDVSDTLYPPRIGDAFVQVSVPVSSAGSEPAILTAEFSVKRFLETYVFDHEDDVTFHFATSAEPVIPVIREGGWEYIRFDDYVVAAPRRANSGNRNIVESWSRAHIGVIRTLNLPTTSVTVGAWKPLREGVQLYRENLLGLIGTLLGITIVAVILAMMIGNRFARLIMEVQKAIGSLPNLPMRHRALRLRGIAEIDRMLESVAEKNDFLIAEIEEVKRLQRRFEHLRRFAPMAIYALERRAGGEWRIAYYGPAMDRLLGIDDDDIHTADRFLERVYPSHRTAVIAAWRRFLRTGSIKHEFRVRGADGIHRWVYNELSRIDEESIGGNEYAIGAIADINQRKQNAMRIKTSANLITLGEMATGMAHELNQPLNVIRLVAENMQARAEKSGIPAELSTYFVDKLKRISDQTQRAAQIIDHMRIFGRRPDREPVAFGVNEAVEGAMTMTGAQLRVAGLRLETDLAVGLPSVVGHQQMLEQVLINLILNARDALRDHEEAEKAIAGTPEIDGRVCIETGFDADRNRVLVQVADNGPGIPAEIRNRIFEPFYTTKPVGKGTGLGLSVSYGIIVEMGGTIDVSSTRNNTVFSISLPPAAPSVGDPAPLRVAEPAGTA